jgi:hypothetical protein
VNSITKIKPKRKTTKKPVDLPDIEAQKMAKDLDGIVVSEDLSEGEWEQAVRDSDFGALS